MEKRVNNDIRNIIKLLQDIVDKYPDEDIPVSVNLYNDNVLALQSICLDNTVGYDGIQVLFEADGDNSLQQTQEFMFYTQGEDL